MSQLNDLKLIYPYIAYIFDSEDKDYFYKGFNSYQELIEFENKLISESKMTIKEIIIS
jgi:hypothetical protein